MLTARLILSKSELTELWNIHNLFNRKLSDFIRLLVRAVAGKCGDNETERKFYRDFVGFILASDAKNAKYLFNGVANDQWVANSANKIKVEMTEPDGSVKEVTGADVTGQALDLLAQGKKLFRKNELFSGLPRWAGEFILGDAVAFFSGHQAQVQLWETEHALWEKKKRQWEEENPEYMNVRPKLVRFHQNEGSSSLSSRRLRWHKYLDFFESNPEFAAWRGKSDPVVRPLDEAGLESVKKAFQNEKAKRKLQAFFRVNPELKILDIKHAEYEKEFAPRAKKLRSGKVIQTDGFKLRPRFTLPDAARHPRYLYLNGEQTSPNGYRRLMLPGKRAGTLEINVSGDSTKSEWKSYSFRGDDRFWQFQQQIVDVEAKKRSSPDADPGDNPAEAPEADETAANDKKAPVLKKKIVYSYNDPHLNENFAAEIKSARLRFITDRGGEPRRAYLEFSVKRECREIREKAAAIKFVPLKRGDREWKQLTFVKDTTIAFFHLGITSACYATLATGEQGKTPTVLDSRRLWLSHMNETEGKWKGEPKIEDILRHDRELRGKTSQRTKLVKGEVSDAALRKHIRLMENDRYKKTARRIIDYAINKDERQYQSGVSLPEADVIIIGDFSGVGVSGKNPRSLNRLISLWKRPQIIALVKDMAAEAGIKVLEASSWGGSQVCSRCGSLGRRYLITSRNKKEETEVRFSEFGRHFGCPGCGHRDNAEKNAVFNLVNTLFTKGEHFEHFREFLKLAPQEKFSEIKAVEEKLMSGPKDIRKAISR